MTKKRRNALILVIKLLVAAALLTWVMSKVHWSDYPGSDGVQRPGFFSSIRGANVQLLAVAVVGVALSWLIISLRWRSLLRVQDVLVSVWESFRLTFMGQFFNYVLIGTVGGDVVKAYYVSRHTPRKAAVLVSAFVDRMMGLTEFALLANAMILLVLLTRRESVESIEESLIVSLAALALVTFAMVFLLSSRFRRVFHLQKLYQRLPFAHHIDQAGEAAKRYRAKPAVLIGTLGMTFVAHVMWISSIAMIGRSLSLSTPFYAYFIYIPLIYIIGAVPITPGGFGVIEGMYVAFFSSDGNSESAVFALALLARLIPVFWTIPGALVAITGMRLPKTREMETELGIVDDDVRQ